MSRPFQGNGTPSGAWRRASVTFMPFRVLAKRSGKFVPLVRCIRLRHPHDSWSRKSTRTPHDADFPKVSSVEAQVYAVWGTVSAP